MIVRILFNEKMAIKVENGDFSQIIKQLDENYTLFEVWGMLWEAQIDEKTVSKTACIWEVILNGYQLHF